MSRSVVRIAIATVIDGGGLRPYGIVVIADGVRVENLTVTGATFYGVLFTGLHDANGPSAHTADGYHAWDPAKFPPLQRFRVDHVTAHNNGLYGIYAFDARHGVIADSYASGLGGQRHLRRVSAPSATSWSAATWPNATRSASRTPTPRTPWW